MNEFKQAPLPVAQSLQEEGCKTSSLLNKECFDIHWQYLNSLYIKRDFSAYPPTQIQANLQILHIISQHNFVPSKGVFVDCFTVLQS